MDSEGQTPLLLYSFFINKNVKYNKFHILNISIILFLSLICYKFYLGLNLLGFITLIISFLTSFFIFNKIKFSDNSLIKFLQIIIIYTFIFILNIALMFIIGWYFNLIPVAYSSSELENVLKELNGNGFNFFSNS